ncbi:MAG TPA: ABC transporter ATP-binding protein [Polyangia bacterium]|nr:ABC transporter ATP-binding protein [Polyangia bacterium]
MLEVRHLSAGYGDVQILRDVSLSVQADEIATLIGSNGAGKSTLLNAVCGILQPQGGSVLFEGEDLSGRSPEEIVARGITQVPEGRRLFPLMTVRENLLVGAYRRKDARGIADDLQRVLALFPRLRERAAQRAGTLSGGEQQMCAIGRGLMARPRLLLLDELSLGLAPIVLDVLADAIREVHRTGTSILLVEQDVAVACDIAQTGYVLENGRVALSGPTAQLRVDPHVARAYLGI